MEIKITIKLSDKEIKLSEQEAIELYLKLKKLYGAEEKEYIPYPVYPQPVYPTSPWITYTNKTEAPIIHNDPLICNL